MSDFLKNKLQVEKFLNKEKKQYIFCKTNKDYWFFLKDGLYHRPCKKNTVYKFYDYNDGRYFSGAIRREHASYSIQKIKNELYFFSNASENCWQIDTLECDNTPIFSFIPRYAVFRRFNNLVAEGKGYKVIKVGAF